MPGLKFLKLDDVKKVLVLKRDLRPKKYANKLEIKEVWQRIKMVLKCC